MKENESSIKDSDESSVVNSSHEERSMHMEHQASDSSTKKQIKALTCAFICVLVIVVGLVGYIVLDKTVWNEQSNPTTGDAETPLETPENATIVEITDGNIKDGLNEKTAILLSASFDGVDWTSTAVSNAYNYLHELLTNGDLTENQRLYSILYALYHQDAFSKITTSDYSSAEANNIIKDTTIEGYPNEFYNYVEKIDADAVAKLYKDLFGEDVKHQSSKEICGGFLYDADKGLYLKGLFDACGGASPMTYNIYREKYETVGDEAHAYLRIGSVKCDYNSTDCVYYGEYLSNDDATNGVTPLGTLTSNSYFGGSDNRAIPVITDDNFEQFSRYRIVFHKTPDGNYVFHKLEKL